MNWQELEDKFVDAIQQCCQTEEDKEAAKKYYHGMTVGELIDSALTG